MYLLQLVQALKFESAASEQRSSRSTTSAISYDDSGLTDFLIARGVQNPTLGNRLYWYLIVEVELELEDRVVAKMYGRVVFKFLSKILEVIGHLGSSLSLMKRPLSPRMASNAASSREGKASSSRRLPNEPRSYAYLKTHDPRKSKNFAPLSMTPRTGLSTSLPCLCRSMHALRLRASTLRSHPSSSRISSPSYCISSPPMDRSTL